MKTWYAIRARDEGAEVMIYDEIGAYGVSAKAFLAELGDIPGDGALTVRINSPGGSVFDAVAIYNALKRHHGPVTVWIDGLAASAASYVAMAGDEVVMPENAFLMIHDPSGMVLGTAGDMRAMAEALDKIKGSLVTGYVAKSGAADEDIAALMAKETWFDATEAVELGFADRLAEPVRMAARFDLTRFRNAPPAVAEATALPQAAELGAPEAPDHSPPAVAEITALPQAAEGEIDPASAVDPPMVADDEAAVRADASNASEPPVDVSATIRAETLAHARAVVDLCRLAGMPQLAVRFLESDTSLEAVGAALLEAKAEAAPPIDGHHPQPGRFSGARPWGEVIARAFRPTPGQKKG
jgi:ATP-dependent protease ClpP protease subunit